MESHSEISPVSLQTNIFNGSNGVARWGGSQRLETLGRHFTRYRPQIPLLSGITKRSAVLICLFQGENDELRVILTKRASNISSHPGEVALPGGKREEGDVDDVHTALREAKEEIGLDSSLVNVVTILEPFVTKYGMVVFPVIGVLRDKKAFSPVPNAAEVEAVFNAPLEMFLKNDNRKAEEREWKGDKYLLHFFEFGVDNKKYIIWALTAGILISAASVIYQRPPEFTERKPKFWSRDADKEPNMPEV